MLLIVGGERTVLTICFELVTIQDGQFPPVRRRRAGARRTSKSGGWAEWVWQEHARLCYLHRPLRATQGRSLFDFGCGPHNTAAYVSLMRADFSSGVGPRRSRERLYPQRPRGRIRGNRSAPAQIKHRTCQNQAPHHKIRCT